MCCALVVTLVSYFRRRKRRRRFQAKRTKGADRKLGGEDVVDNNQTKGKYKKEVRSIYMLYWSNVQMSSTYIETETRQGITEKGYNGGRMHVASSD
jgi:hypothetical protein